MAELYDSIWHFNQKMYIEKLHFSVSANLFVLRPVFYHVGGIADNRNSPDDSDNREWESARRLLDIS